MSHRFALGVAVAMVVGFGGVGVARASVINFDGASAPCVFSQTTPLNTYYGGLGVTFTGNGAILNQCSNFGVPAKSGSNFWAFNTSQGSTVASISFDQVMGKFSIELGTGQAGTYSVVAYGSSGNVIGSTAGSNLAGGYAHVSLNTLGIKSLVLTNTAATFVYDDLRFQAVPEPATWAMMIAGFGLTGAALRRRQTLKVNWAV